MYNKENNTFSNYVNGSYEESSKSGYFLGDGWVKLAKYDSDLLNLFILYATDEEKMKISYQEFQFKCNLFEAECFNKNKLNANE